MPRYRAPALSVSLPSFTLAWAGPTLPHRETDEDVFGRVERGEVGQRPAWWHPADQQAAVASVGRRLTRGTPPPGSRHPRHDVHRGPQHRPAGPGPGDGASGSARGSCTSRAFSTSSPRSAGGRSRSTARSSIPRRAPGTWRSDRAVLQGLPRRRRRRGGVCAGRSRHLVAAPCRRRAHQSRGDVTVQRRCNIRVRCHGVRQQRRHRVSCGGPWPRPSPCR